MKNSRPRAYSAKPSESPGTFRASCALHPRDERDGYSFHVSERAKRWRVRSEPQGRLILPDRRLG